MVSENPCLMPHERDFKTKDSGPYLLKLRHFTFHLHLTTDAVPIVTMPHTRSQAQSEIAKVSKSRLHHALWSEQNFIRR